MRRIVCGCLVPLFSALLPAARPRRNAMRASPESPQFVAQDCAFRNPPNPNAKPHRSSWDIWSRLLLEKKQGTVPVDPIPVRTLDRAALDALDAASNHIIRLGHSSHLLKLRGKWWLIDPVFGPRASPVSLGGPEALPSAPPVALADVPPIEGLVLSHDHYDHLDVPTIEALKGRVQTYFVPLGVGARLREWGVPAERIEEMRLVAEQQVGRRRRSRRRPPSISRAARCGTATARCGLRGAAQRQRAHLLQRRLRLLPRLQGDRRAAGRRSTSR